MSGARIEHVEAAALTGRPLRYFDYVMAAFVTILLLSNVLGAGKVAVVNLPGIGPWPFGAGILFASICAFWAGEFVNSYVLARMKVWTEGRYLWTRTIGSTIAGEGVDSLIFYPLAFWGAQGWTDALVIKVLLTQWGLKVAWEAILTPVTYAVVGWLKRREG